MPRAKLPPQALPPDKRPPPLPDAFEDRLPSGRTVRWRMPDPLTLVTFDGVIPDPLTAAVIDLLRDEKSYKDPTDPMRHKHEANNIKGMYGLAGAMWVDPKLDISVEYGDGNGTLGRREVGYQDIIATFQLYCFTTGKAPRSPANTEGAERLSDTPPDSDGVRTDAGTATTD